MSDTAWRGVFLAAAVFNWLSGLLIMFDTSPLAAQAGIELARYDPLYSPFVGWFAIVFGTLYFIVARDITQNRGAVVGGALAKVGMFALVWLAVLRGDTPVTMGYLLTGHLAFALAFVAFLLRTRRA